MHYRDLRIFVKLQDLTLTMQRLLLVMGALLCAHISVFAQETCLSFELVDTANVNCSACLTLEAPFTQIYETNTYAVTSIDPTLLYPINVGTAVGVGVDDTWSAVIPLGFDFCFFDQTYSSIVLGSNGILSFNLANAGGYNEWNFNQTCPSNQLPVNSIFMPYHDIDPSVCGAVRYQVYGQAPCRKFVVSYDNVCLFSCTNLQSSSQVVLSEGSNAIQIFIVNKAACVNWNQGNGLIGIQNTAGTVGFTPPGRNTGPWAASNEAWQFNPNGTALGSVAWFEDGVEIGSGESIEVCPEMSKHYTAELRYEPCSTLLGGGNCVNYQVFVNAGDWPGEVSWDLVNQDGSVILSGGAPFSQNVCLPNGCYTLQMFDSFGDGWNGSNFTVSYGGVVQGTGTIANGGIGSSSFCLDSFVPGDDEEEGPPLWASDSIFVALNLPEYAEGLVLPDVICAEGEAVLLGANEPGGLWSAGCDTCLNDDLFMPSGLPAGEYEVVYTIDTECGPIDQSGVIQIEAYPELILSGPEQMCLYDDPIQLLSNLEGGEWISPNCEDCLNEVDETFTPSDLTGSFELQYTFGENCVTTESISIEVLALDTFNISLPEAWCASTVLNLNTYGENGTWESSCFDCLDDDGGFLGLNNGEGMVNFTFLPEGPCPVESQDEVFISLDVDANITAPSEVCETAAEVQLIAPSGGIWSSNCGDCLSEEGVFYPLLVDGNVAEINYAIDSVCSDFDEVSILILEELSAVISPVGPICENEEIVLSAIGDEGTWTANCNVCIDPESGVFNASLAGPGTFDVNYEFDSSCAQNQAISIDVISAVSASISDVPPICEDELDVQLSAEDQGGTWLASCDDCISQDGLFLVDVVVPGVYEVNYIIEGVCSDEDVYFLEVIEKANASIVEPGFLCAGSPIATLTSVNEGGTWSADCGSCIDELSGLINLEVLPIGMYTVDYTIDGFCGDTQSAFIELVPCDLTIPNVFSPNGDGLNEVFEVENLLYFDNVRFQVFNRWGQEVYSDSNYRNNWDGAGLSEGTYFFLMDVPLLGKFRGELTLLR